MLPTNASNYLRGSTLYFFLFMAYGCISPFIPIIWRSNKGLSEHQVGLLAAIEPVASFFVTPVVCAIAGRRRIEQKVLYGALALYATTRSSILVATGFLAVGGVEVLCAVCKCPIGSLIDSAMITSCGGDGYGKQRLWGAIGVGVASLLGGYAIDSSHGDYGGGMALFVAMVLVTLMASTRVSIGGGSGQAEWDDTMAEKAERHPIFSGSGGRTTSAGKNYLSDNPGSATETPSVATTKASRYTSSGKNGFKTKDVEKGELSGAEKGSILSVVWLMLSTAEHASFFATVGLSGMGAGILDTFLLIRLKDLGGSHVLCGLARLVMCLAEVPLFYLSGPLIKRLGVRGVIVLAQLAYLARFLYYSVLQQPWYVLPVEVLHGFTFAAMWAATTNYAHAIAPANLRTTIQGVVSGLHYGLGFGLGAILGGFLYSGLGARLCFRAAAMLPSLSLLVLALPTLWGWFTTGKRLLGSDAVSYAPAPDAV